MRAERLPFALRGHLLLDQLVAFPFVDVKHVDFRVLHPARQIGEDGSPLAQVSDHVAADVASENRTRERILEQDLDHLFIVVISMQVDATVRKSTEKIFAMPVVSTELLPAYGAADGCDEC
jgi:hypothetical protein